MRAVDPRKGVVHIGMRERPLMAAVPRSEGLFAELFRVGVDAVLPGGRVTAAALRTLLDFTYGCYAEERNSTKPPTEESSAVAEAQAPQASPHIGLKGVPVPTPIAARLTIAGLPQPVSRQSLGPPRWASAGDGVAVSPQPQFAYAAPATLATIDHIVVKGTPIPTPLAARFSISEDILRPPSRTSGLLGRALIGDGERVPSPPQLVHALPAAHKKLAPLPPLLPWGASHRTTSPPELRSISEVHREVLSPRTIVPKANSLGSISEIGHEL